MHIHKHISLALMPMYLQHNIYESNVHPCIRREIVKLPNYIAW